VTATGSAVLIAGANSTLSAPLEAAFLRAGVAVHRINEPESLTAAGLTVSNVPLAVLQVAVPVGHGQELRAFRNLVYEQLHGLVAVMPGRAKVLVVVDGRAPMLGGRPPAHSIGSIMARLRAAAAREDARSVMVNAVFLTGVIDDGTMAVRVREAMCTSSFPDSGFLVFDEDVRDQSIVNAIAEQCS
jgi:hypothetical protein